MSGVTPREFARLVARELAETPSFVDALADAVTDRLELRIAPQPRAYRPEQTAELLNVSRDVIYRAIQPGGQLPSVKLDGARLIPTRAIDELLGEAEDVPLRLVVG